MEKNRIDGMKLGKITLNFYCGMCGNKKCLHNQYSCENGGDYVRGFKFVIFSLIMMFITIIDGINYYIAFSIRTFFFEFMVVGLYVMLNSTLKASKMKVDNDI